MLCLSPSGKPCQAVHGNNHKLPFPTCLSVTAMNFFRKSRGITNQRAFETTSPWPALACLTLIVNPYIFAPPHAAIAAAFFREKSDPGKLAENTDVHRWEANPCNDANEQNGKRLIFRNREARNCDASVESCAFT
jgi:hypothetical protein